MKSVHNFQSKNGFTRKVLATTAAVGLLAATITVSIIDPTIGKHTGITADATNAAIVRGGEWVPVENQANAWYYVTPDGVHHSDCFAFDGYYVEASGVRMLSKKMLDVDIPMRNSWLTANEAGTFDCFVANASQMQQKLQAVMGKYRRLTVYSNTIRLTSLVENDNASYVVDRLALYKNSDINGYSIMVATSLGGDRKIMSGVIGDVDLIAYYDYEVLRFFTNSISRNGDLLASAIYSHWQDTNEQGLKFGEWVVIGDTMVRYMPSNGQGLYEIKAVF
ncbi:hypothetical protein [Butyrivibrio sp. WCD3002]|uniref:hypothetical protein n=1 Tax=Butyrivibrio sp. WCD3002 TaxID=1280676 RepID=UPI00041A76FA|nr:hypothetical protein [Butyrivibrio sp. WCD3002]